MLRMGCPYWLSLVQSTNRNLRGSEKLDLDLLKPWRVSAAPAASDEHASPAVQHMSHSPSHTRSRCGLSTPITRTILSSATTRTSPSLIQAEGLRLLPKFLGNGPVQWPLKHNEVQHWLLQCTLFHITLYYYIEHKYVLLLNIMILPITMYYYKLLQIHYYILLHYYNIIITLL